MYLYPPGTTTVTPICTDKGWGTNSVGSTQKLTVAGTYTIILKETMNGATLYGLTLERINPVPSDATALILKNTVAGEVTPPTAQDVYTFFGATSGTYQITVNLLTGSQTDVCFNVYQTGASVLNGNPPCTDTGWGTNTIQELVTPKQAGTFLVLIWSSTNDGTVNYNVDVSCYLGSCPVVQPPPRTTCTETPTYNATTGTLTMDFTIATPGAVTWNGWLVDGDTVQNMWTVSQPKTEPNPVTVTKTHSVAAKSGVVGILSTFYTPPTTTATGGITCSSWQTISTGKP
jgi:hypothetical protein